MTVAAGGGGSVLPQQMKETFKDYKGCTDM